MHLRLLTYNIHKCIGVADRRYNPGRIVDVIAHYNPDIVLLQEVDDEARRSKFDRQVDLLGDRLGFRHRIWYPNVSVRSGGKYGNAILCRYPLMECSNIDLTIPPKKKRSVLHSRFRMRIAQNGSRRAQTRTVHVFNLHLGLSGIERRLQLKKFLDSHPFNNLDRRTPIVVGGDFNDLWASLGKSTLAPAGFRSGKIISTYPSVAPIRPLDCVYVRGQIKVHHIMRSRLQAAKYASDHLPLVVDLEIT
jgi:endonuclease/exonuclease/phosphatase family metal-dependent hydrolase